MAEIPPSVQLGQGVVIGDEVSIGENCVIGHYSIIEGKTRIGPGNEIGHHVVIGAPPQDRKYKGGGVLSIGANNIFREFSTVHVGHLDPGGTIIGDGNYFLATSHVAHDCKIGNDNFIANGTLLAGHTKVGDGANISGMVGTHQFCRIGSHVMISGHAGLRQDVYPWSMVQGEPAVHIGINHVGLKRKGWNPEQLFQLKEAFRLLRKGVDEAGENVYLAELLEFKKSSERGMAKFGHRIRTR